MKIKMGSFFILVLVAFLQVNCLEHHLASHDESGLSSMPPLEEQYTGRSNGFYLGQSLTPAPASRASYSHACREDDSSDEESGLSSMPPSKSSNALRSHRRNVPLSQSLQQYQHHAAASSSSCSQADCEGCSSLSASSSSVLSLRMEQYLKLRKFLIECNARIPALDHPNKDFITMFAIALAVWKHDSKPVLMAMKAYMAYKGLSWGILRLDRWVSGSLESTNFVVHTGAISQEEVSEHTRTIEGQTYILNLDDKELLTGTTFRQLLANASQDNPYTLARVTTNSVTKPEYNYVDAKRMQNMLLRVDDQANSLIKEVVSARDENLNSLKIAFPGSSKSIYIEEIHYYELSDLSTPQFKHLGSLHDIFNPGNLKVKEKLLKRFVSNLPQEQIGNELLAIKKIMERHTYGCGDYNQVNNIERLGIVLKAILARLAKLDATIDMQKEIVLAKYLLAITYKENGDLEKALNEIDNILKDDQIDSELRDSIEDYLRLIGGSPKMQGQSTAQGPSSQSRHQFLLEELGEDEW
ncbi:MAG: hypothetical protein P4L22_06085 [Candidatus Babeliales bacterium]|nr:hypothetical protein [Candidatus Babeliales bacterium]